MRLRLLLIGLIAVPALAACGGGGAGGTPSASVSAAMSDAQIQAIVNEMVQCIRSNGAPGMPDLKVENGRVVEPDENSVDQATRTNMDSAVAACQSIEDRLPAAVWDKDSRSGDERAGPTAQDVPALRKFAQCMRDNGIAEWPDPKADGSFPKAGNPLDAEGKSPRIVAAFKACEQFWNGGLRFT